MDELLTKGQLLVEKEVATAILNGSKTADLAKQYGINYSSCREMLHRYCRRMNRKAYEEISIWNANRESCSPFLEQLRDKKYLFIEKPKTRKVGIIEKEIKKESELLEKSDIVYRKHRCKLDQLYAELKQAKDDKKSNKSRVAQCIDL